MKRQTQNKLTAIVAAALLAAPVSGPVPVYAQEEPAPSSPIQGGAQLKDKAGQVPDELQGVGIEEKLDDPVPMEVEFVNEDGKTVKLGSYFQGDKPVIFNLGYYRCPMLCGLVRNGMLEALKDVDMMPGRDFEIVTLSVDPLETAPLAKQKKQTYIKNYGNPSAALGWHFLTGQEKNIRKLTDAIGFDYKYNPARQEYAHGSGIIIATPDGKVSRYLYGIQYEPKTLRLSLVEASDGKIGSTLDKVTLYCFHYDPKAGSYSFAAFNIMRAGGLFTVLILASVLSVFWHRERKKHRQETSTAEGSQS